MMRKFSFKLAFIVGVVSLMSCQSTAEKRSRVNALPYYSDATFTPQWFSSDSKELDTLHRIADFDLINQDGEKTDQNTFKNKIYVADFFFTECPGICPKMTKNLARIQTEFKNDEHVSLLSHSVTPEKDSVAVLKAYANNMGVISGKWHLVTGNRKEIYELGRKVYFIEEDLGFARRDDEFLHTENFVLIDKNKHIRGIYNGLNTASVNQLISDIKTLKQE